CGKKAQYRLARRGPDRLRHSSLFFESKRGKKVVESRSVSERQGSVPLHGSPIKSQPCLDQGSEPRCEKPFLLVAKHQADRVVGHGTTCRRLGTQPAAADH